MKASDKLMWGGIVVIVATWIALTASYAQAEEETLVGTIIAHKYSFGQTKKDIRTRTEVIKDVDLDTCVTDAEAIQQAYRIEEALDADRVRASSWVEVSEAFCSTTFVVTPSQVMTVSAVCELTYDKTSGVSALEQLEAACPVL